MERQTLEECLKDARDYLEGSATGFSLIINAKNYGDFNKVRERLANDANIKKVYVSDLMSEDSLPNVNDLYAKTFGRGDFLTIGVSESLMLKGETALIDELRPFVKNGTKGHTIILLCHMESYLKSLILEDERLEKRIVFLRGENYEPPVLMFTKENATSDTRTFRGIKSLIYELERFTGIPQNKEFLVTTKFSPNFFANSLYPIKSEPTVYDKLRAKYPELGEGVLSEESGKDTDWAWLSNELQKSGTLENLIKNYFGDTGSLLWQLSDEIKKTTEQRRWLYWLSLNIYPPVGEYFRMAISRSNSLSELENELYFTLLDINCEDENFIRLYFERKKILGKIPTNQNIVIRYCNNVGQKDKAAVYYLTDKTEIERIKLLKCLSAYEYTDKELEEILKQAAPELEIYLRPYKIALQNIGTALIEDDILSAVSAYFTEYKRQKLTNKIKKEFLLGVEEYAHSRPYNKFLTRLALLNQLSVKNAKVFFFDALGVEYLSYIAAKCEEIGFTADIKISRGELPSITTQNKDFENFFIGGEIYKIDELDECKHHSKKFDYQKCREPLHIFDELKIIDDEIKKIYAKMASEHIEKAVIVSDHGASRLTVINESENDAIVLAKKGEHSGRCEPVEKDPQIPFATYENGYAVLANYDRFKGGRKANVEVHGGATLEEVLVPIIVLSLRPEKLEYSFVESELLFNPGQDACLTLFCNAPMNNPRLRVKDKFYDGNFTVDKEHAKFILKGVRRKGKYIAEVYDGDVSQGISLNFEIKKQTQEDDLGI